MSSSSTSSKRRSDEGSNISAKMTAMIKREMGDTWRHDSKFFKKFFPVGMKIKAQCVDIKQRLYNFSKERWTGIPQKPASSASLSTVLLHLLNGILKDTEAEKTRSFFKTNRQKVETGRTTVTTPSIFLAGTGSEFMNTGVGRPFAQYAQGIAALEVRLQSQDIAQGQGRLAVHAHEMFCDQENRRFVFGVVLTQHTLTVCMFDHSGAIFSDPLDYHHNPELFCAVILGMASNDAVRLGFDSTMYSENRSAKVRTTQIDDVRRLRSSTRNAPPGIVYTIDSHLFRFRTVVGKGTLCWVAFDDRTNEKYVVKDSWVPFEELPGRESEGSLLRHAQSRGLTRGISQIRHYEEVHVGDNAVADTVMRNRRTRGTVDFSIERIHSRLILSTYGKPLDQFSTRRELLLAYHDVILAHRNLYENAGILHRDISLRNILINLEGLEGDRGVLIDFDSAIRVGDTSPYSTKRGIGTWPYKSRNVHQYGPHSYFDDLESFYYVLCTITVGNLSPRKLRSSRPDILEGFNGKYAQIAKEAFISARRGFDLPISDWFGDPFRTLCVRLHAFFNTRHWAAEDADIEGKTSPIQIPSRDYDEFLGHVTQAITELDAWESSHAGYIETSTSGCQQANALDTGEPARPQASKTRTKRIPPIIRPRRRDIIGNSLCGRVGTCG